MKAILTIGVSGSGKSTWAQDQPLYRVERDIVRREIMELAGGTFSWDKWNWKNESKVTEICNQLIADYASEGKDIVVSDTNLNPERLENLKSFLKSLGYEVSEKVFYISFEEAVKRDMNRLNPVGYSVIARQMEQFNRLMKFHETPNHKLIRPRAVMVDLDGTLAHADGKRGMFEWSKVGSDSVDSIVKASIDGLYNAGYMIIFASGRDGICRPETTAWLQEVFKNREIRLFMRKEGDCRPDQIIKEEIYLNEIEPYWDVKAVFDDRPKVVRMWQKLGLKTVILGNPWIEF